MNTDTPSDTSADGEIQLNQRTLDAIIQGVTTKLQEATKPPEAPPRPPTGEYGLVYIASGVQLAPTRAYPTQYTKAAGRRLHRARTWDSKLLAGCSRPQALFNSNCSACKDPSKRAWGLWAGSPTGHNGQANGRQGAAGPRYTPRVASMTASKRRATISSSSQAPQLVLLHPNPGPRDVKSKGDREYRLAGPVATDSGKAPVAKAARKPDSWYSGPLNVHSGH